MGVSTVWRISGCSCYRYSNGSSPGEHLLMHLLRVASHAFLLLAATRTATARAAALHAPRRRLPPHRTHARLPAPHTPAAVCLARRFLPARARHCHCPAWNGGMEVVEGLAYRAYPSIPRTHGAHACTPCCRAHLHARHCHARLGARLPSTCSLPLCVAGSAALFYRLPARAAPPLPARTPPRTAAAPYRRLPPPGHTARTHHVTLSFALPGS